MAVGKIDAYPTSTVSDLTGLVGQAGTGSVPVLGGVLAPLVGFAIAIPLERRRASWFNRLAEGLSELEARIEGFDPKALADNEDFVSAVYSTTDAAMRASHEQKRKRLANVVLNIAAGRSIEEALRERFIGLVQMLSEEHILLLKIASAPKSFERIAHQASGLLAGGRGRLYASELAYHGVSDRLFKVVADDLEREDFISGNFNVTMSAEALLERCTTDRGEAFLEFISSPLPANP